MSNTRHQVGMVVDGYTRVCLTLIVALLSVLIVGLWSQYTPLAGNASAADPILNPQAHASAQRDALLKAQETTNQNLQKLIGLFETGQAKVQLVNQTEKEAGNAATPAKASR